MNNVSSVSERGKDIYEVAIKFDDLTISKREIGLSLGYTDGVIPPHFEEMLEFVLSQLEKRCEIQAGYRILNVTRVDGRNDGLSVGGTFFKTHSIVYSQLRKAESAALFICSIGNAMETWSKELAAGGDMPLSYIVDTVASETVEQVTDVLHDIIGEQMQARGLNITNRYSPGYCNWSVSEQHILFSFLPNKFCGITLSDSALMIPIKSVSGIIGIGKDVKRMDYICDSCGVKDCTYRAILLAREERTKSKQ